MKEKQKIRLKKRSEQEIKLRRGFELPARAGNGTVSFTSIGDLRAKYFRTEGRLARRPFILRTLVLMAAQVLYSLILYSRFVESLLIGRQDLAILFFIIFIILSIPVVVAEFSLGVRRCHDLNIQGAAFIIPLFFYLSLYILPLVKNVLLWNVFLAAAAVMYLCLFTMNKKDKDNIYGEDREV